MPAHTTVPEEVLASCSFCGKANTAVNALVAGPGVFICDECVDLSGTIVAATADLTPEERARLRAEALDPPVEDMLALLPALARAAARVEAELARWVARLRARGTGWQQIADVLGISADNARQRFDPAPS